MNKTLTALLLPAFVVALIVPTVAANKPASMNAKPPASKTCSACSMKGMQAGAKGDMPKMQMMPMMQTMHPAISVDGSDIYVVQGNEIIKLDKVELKVIARTMLPSPSQPTNKMGGMMGSDPGMKGGMQCGMKDCKMGDKMAPGGMPMMQMMQTMHPAIAVDSSDVYVVRGNEIIKLGKVDLRVLAQTTLPHSESAGMAGSMDKMTP